MGKYRTLGTLFNRVFRNDLNQNFEDIDKDIQTQKKRVDDLITKTPQPSEVVDARGDFPILRNRLDDIDDKFAHIDQMGHTTFTYDDDGNVTTIETPTSTITFTYTGGVVTKITEVIGDKTVETTFNYDGDELESIDKAVI